MTDYWRKTFYSPVINKGNAPMLAANTASDCWVETSFTLTPAHQFDQAGLMLRLDYAHWVKAGIEYSDNLPRLSVVVTDEFSAWSAFEWQWNTSRGQCAGGKGLRVVLCRVQAIFARQKEAVPHSASLKLRLYRIGDSLVVEVLNDKQWQYISIAHMSGLAGSHADMGIFAASPGKEGGGIASFDSFSLTPCPVGEPCFWHNATDE
ncbi:unnamed protein product [Chrysoparadoxa australica]